MTSVEPTAKLAAEVGFGVLPGRERLVTRRGRTTAVAQPTRRPTRWRHPATDLVAAGLSVLVLVLAANLHAAIAGAVPALWGVLLLLTGTYDARLALVGRLGKAKRVLQAGMLLGLGCWVASTLTSVPASPAQLLVLTGALTATTLAVREIAALVAHGLGSARRSAVTRVVVAGDADQVLRTVEELRRTPRLPFEVVSVCVTGPEPSGLFDVPVGVGLDRLVSTAADCSAEAVVVLPSQQLDARTLQRLGWQLETSRTQLFLGTGLLDVSAARTTFTAAGGLRMLHVRSADHHGAARLVKDVWERVAAALLLLLMSPLLLGIVVVIRRGTPGAAIFPQERVGRDGQRFTMYKFRTMSADAHSLVKQMAAQHDGHGLLFKLHSDPRVTSVGRVLRRYSLDELPQLLNVVLGQMSLVGPRPALPEEVEQYDHDPRRRLAVKPGLTGLWQVSGRSDLSWEETVRLDLSYVDNWSLGLDLSIVMRTAHAVLGHRGAY